MVTNDNSGDISRETLARLQQLSDFMDRAFLIPGTSIQFGLDSIVGLIPVIGDTATVAISGYIYSFANKAGVPRKKRLKMLWNIFIDWFVGLIPLFGDIFDVAFKANSKNVRIILAHVENQLDTDTVESAHGRTA